MKGKHWKRGGDSLDIFRIAVLGIAGVMLCIVLKEVKPEYSGYTALAVGILLLICSTGRLRDLAAMFEKIREYLPVDRSYLDTLLRMIGITYIGQFASGLCKDAGYSAIAGQIELFSKISVLSVGMPVLLALLDTIQGFIQ